MLSRHRLLDLGTAPDVPALQRQLVAAAEDLGFGRVAAVLIRGRLESRNAWMKSIDNTPAGFLAAQRCLDDTLRDPVMAGLQRGPSPLLYDQRTYVDAGAADLWDAQAPWGYACGVACAVHEPSHVEQLALGVDRDGELPSDPLWRMRVQAVVQLLAVQTHAALRALLDGPPVAELTTAERDCLRWLAEGRTVRHVAAASKTSEGAVLAVVSGAATKAGTTPRAAALRVIKGTL